MKLILQSAAMMAALCLTLNLTAQPTPPPPPPSEPAPAAEPAPTAPPAPEAESADPTIESDQALRQAEKLQREAERMAQLDEYKARQMEKDAQNQSKIALAQSGQAYSWSTGNGGSYSGPFGNWESMGGRAERSLVIRSSDSDPKIIAEEEEDLNIMAHILEKAIHHSDEESETRPAMGINVKVNVFANNSVNNLQIEGYGAVFMLKVGYPLAGPAAETEEKNSKDNSNSTWDEARREVYGGRSEGRHEMKIEYDSKLVENLKTSLVEALKSASNMRDVKPDESVTLVISSGGNSMLGDAFAYQSRVTAIPPVPPAAGGSGGSGGSAPKAAPPRHGNMFMRQAGANGPGDSILTIRARKSDIDAFAKAKLSSAEFRGKVSILLY